MFPSFISDTFQIASGYLGHCCGYMCPSCEFCQQFLWGVKIHNLQLHFQFVTKVFLTVILTILQ